MISAVNMLVVLVFPPAVLAMLQALAFHRGWARRFLQRHGAGEVELRKFHQIRGHVIQISAGIGALFGLVYVAFLAIQGGSGIGRLTAFRPDDLAVSFFFLGLFCLPPLAVSAVAGANLTAFWLRRHVVEGPMRWTGASLISVVMAPAIGAGVFMLGIAVVPAFFRGSLVTMNDNLRNWIVMSLLIAGFVALTLALSWVGLRLIAWLVLHQIPRGIAAGQWRFRRSSVAATFD